MVLSLEEFQSLIVVMIFSTSIDIIKLIEFASFLANM